MGVHARGEGGVIEEAVEVDCTAGAGWRAGLCARDRLMMESEAWRISEGRDER
jgi:hypothetical protein